MGSCDYCNRFSIAISDTIGVCADCIRNRFDEVWPQIQRVHHESRKAFGLPAEPPGGPDGVACNFCFHACRITEGQTGYCGLRSSAHGRIRGGRPHEGNLSYYFDPLPTNCVAGFVCPGGSDSGFPCYSVSEGPEYGRKNLAVFYHACSFNCLFCQNYHFKTETASPQTLTARELADSVDNSTTCICYFGGDPAPQILHAIKASKLALKQRQENALRICWETNGAVQPTYLGQMVDLSLKSGGCIKFDLKAWDERIHLALCGVSNRATLDNFMTVAYRIKQRPDPPPLIASTLLVPGYVDEAEIAGIAGFIADLNPQVPYSLLAFYPQFYLNDLPTTPREQAYRCKLAAEKEGLQNVHLGNLHLL